jgi:cobalamin synthase
MSANISSGIQKISVPLANNFTSLLAAIAFYTCFPIPPNLQLDFARIARWAPLIGVLLGGGLGLVDLGLDWLEMPGLIRSSLVISLSMGQWIPPMVWQYKIPIVG